MLRGDFKQSEYGKIVLPFTILRRLNCLLEDTKKAVLDTASGLPKEMNEQMRTTILSEIAADGGQIYNTSQFTFVS
ncbi:type I restriction-modification system subunit M N-terminal domain-containing protein [Celeribacter halophilus]|uniref:type I restriction-modification system subunit M N-terminal domain-containing protein n=1 Tax=Celeribacter halophilus TaxID=576117 RepID=UPI003A93BCB8